MKYTVVTHGAGYTETLEFRGKTYKKEHEGDSSHTSTGDKDFWKQMEADGIHDERILDAVFENIDNSFFGFDMFGIADELEPYDYENLYFTREEAEAALEKRKEANPND